MLQKSIIRASHEPPSGLQEINGRCWLVILQQLFFGKKSTAKHLDENQGISNLLVFPAAALLECGEPVTLIIIDLLILGLFGPRCSAAIF